MQTNKKIIYIILTIILILLVIIIILLAEKKQAIAPASAPDNPFSSDQPSDQKVGGECTYDSYKGKCKIISVTNGLVKFSYELTDSKEIAQSWFKLTDNKTTSEITFLETNSTSLLSVEECLKKYNIEKDQILPCALDLETRGTCTPTIYKFDDVDKATCLYY